MILTVRELVDHLGMNPKTEVVGASIMVRVLERLGAIKKVGSRPFVDENGKPTIGRPSALYEFPETVTFKMPTEALAFVPKEKKAKKAKKVEAEVDTAVDVIESDLDIVSDAPAVAEVVSTTPVEVETPEVVSVSEVDFSSDELLSQLLRESA